MTDTLYGAEAIRYIPHGIAAEIRRARCEFVGHRWGPDLPDGGVQCCGCCGEQRYQLVLKFNASPFIASMRKMAKAVAETAAAFERLGKVFDADAERRS